MVDLSFDLACIYFEDEDNAQIVNFYLGLGLNVLMHVCKKRQMSDAVFYSHELSFLFITITTSKTSGIRHITNNKSLPRLTTSICVGL